MDRVTIERYQVWIYLIAILAGLIVGYAVDGIANLFNALLWPTLTLLLYVTFVQVPLLHVGDALRDYRFVSAIILGNFALVPLLVWGLLQWLPADPVLRLGILLVLLVPCTDWFITFSQLGGGNVARAIAVTPLNLVLQLLLLPLYLWLMFATPDLEAALQARDLLPALIVVLLPLFLAGLSERWLEAHSEGVIMRHYLAWLPVPLLALVVFLIAGAQIQTVTAVMPILSLIVPVFIVFLFGAALIAKGLSYLLQLPAEQGRTLAFSLGTRNSFVVLPFALALPEGWEMAAIIIVVQSLVELFGMVFYLWWLPKHLFPQ